MIALTDIGFEFGGRFLYRNANWHIKPNERIGLIGLNGTGKSTLLRIINGEYSLTEGSMSKPRDLTIGFLNQDQLSFDSHESILNVALTAFAGALKLEKEIEEIIQKLETDHSDEVLQALSDKQEAFEQLDGYNIHHKTEKILEGLGFTTAQLQQPFNKFSGGWRMRVLLAKMLLQEPNLLMLDEPTNHLDMPSIQWLEEYLKSYQGTVIVVSHDRYFLDRMVTKIVEVSMNKIFEYPGNYSFYIENKAERMELQQRAFDNQQQFIKDQEKLINRFKAKASKAAMAQSRMKMLDRIEKIDAPEDDNRQINIQFRIGQQPGRYLSEISGLSKSFPDVRILNNAEAKIERGDKIALIGANGKGKSTILRMLAGTEPYEGEIKAGYNVRQAFYAQHQLESLNLNNEILQELQEFGSDRSETELRTILGCFLFEGDEVFKRIKVLSGGEKARVALAKTLLTEANFLLLDEPTNHLDMRSINILIQALQGYEGSFVVVSHDRFFVSQIANKIWWIENEEIKEYPGTFDEYEYWRQKREEELKRNPAPKAAPAPKKVVEEKVESAASTKQVSNNYIQKLKKNFEEYEKKVVATKAKIQELEQDFSKPEISSDAKKVEELTRFYEAEKKALVHLEKEMEAILEELIELEA
ncbi:MAG: ATP-binding cassette domain-containing protein [Bacteroidetes bacterium]|nr:ATP-binding cassette domain-containing protein [Bacteroidota bacterium]MCK6610031.1 ATP-binding cassette domain-containing protein [Bacteroidia bacterium]